MPLFVRGVFVAEFQLNAILEPLDAGTVYVLDGFARGGTARGFGHNQIADAYRRAQLQVNTNEIDAAMNHALNLHEAGHWQAFFNFHLAVAATRVVPDPNAAAVAVAETEEQLSTEAATGAALMDDSTGETK